MIRSVVGPAATVLGGVLSGVYVAFEVAVMPALRAEPPAAETVMQEINTVIVQPAFLAVLFGAPVVAVSAAVLRPSTLTVAAAALQVTALIVTIAVNVPLNDALAAGGPWSAFVGPWTAAHRVRTIAALVGTVLSAAG